ncbi:hypothetical protein F4561_006059 [Lipingzhangella halophila]|uniref:Uncharacterized protein n=1 Tax=Lipingzhangella halophila TaxID=1783352 RepID=A0A7W7RNB0_9ACTN|nr:hypothetical protein [Lipingzhangella halophila]MBB4935165.1 hypothetical protein [Lipingzhangella halophila]
MTEAYADPASTVPHRSGGLPGIIAGLFNSVGLGALGARPGFTGAPIGRHPGTPGADLAAEVAALP